MEDVISIGKYIKASEQQLNFLKKELESNLTPKRYELFIRVCEYNKLIQVDNYNKNFETFYKEKYNKYVDINTLKVTKSRILKSLDNKYNMKINSKFIIEIKEKRTLHELSKYLFYNFENKQNSIKSIQILDFYKGTNNSHRYHLYNKNFSNFISNVSNNKSSKIEIISSIEDNNTSSFYKKLLEKSTDNLTLKYIRKSNYYFSSLFYMLIETTKEKYILYLEDITNFIGLTKVLSSENQFSYIFYELLKARFYAHLRNENIHKIVEVESTDFILIKYKLKIYQNLFILYWNMT